jgi:hypothetical protein
MDFSELDFVVLTENSNVTPGCRFVAGGRGSTTSTLRLLLLANGSSSSFFFHLLLFKPRFSDREEKGAFERELLAVLAYGWILVQEVSIGFLAMVSIYSRRQEGCRSVFYENDMSHRPVAKENQDKLGEAEVRMTYRLRTFLEIYNGLRWLGLLRGGRARNIAS